MKFTAWALGPPFLLAIYHLVVYGAAKHRGPMYPHEAITGVWVLVGFPATFLYWVVRLIRRAFSDGSRNEYTRLNDRR